MLKEFKNFALRGNVVDLAIGVIIGAAFGRVVTSLVNDILMPPLGLVIGKVDFSSLFLSLNGHTYPSLAAAKAAGAPTVNFGVFLNTLFDFLIVALAIFFTVRQLNKWTASLTDDPDKKKEVPPQEKLLMEIRDVLKQDKEKSPKAL